MLNGSNPDCPACTHLLEAELLNDPFPKYTEELDSECGVCAPSQAHFKAYSLHNVRLV